MKKTITALMLFFTFVSNAQKIAILPASIQIHDTQKTSEEKKLAEDE